MPYDVMDLDEQTDQQVASYSNLLPDKNVSRNSDNWKRIRAGAMATTDLHANIAVAWRDAMPDTARGAEQVRWATAVGLTKRGATAASGDNAGRVQGTNGSSWTTSDVLVHKSGLTFRAAAGGTLGAPGFALVGIVGIDTGPATRLKAGEVLTWETTPSGLEDEVELAADLSDGGEAEETEGALQVRILNRLAEKARGGTRNDWEQWTLESSDEIATAHVYPNRNGNGSVDIAALKAGSGSTRLLDAGERTALLTALNLLRPVTAAVRVLEVTAQTQDADVIVTPPESDPSFAKDWDDSTPPVVSTWTAATRILVFNAARPASIQPGSRLVISGTSGVELEVEALSSTDAVVLVDDGGQTPAAADLVYSGGPLTTPVRDAILALFDSLGPRVGGFGSGWTGSLRLSNLFETVQTTEGVLDSEIVDPIATVEPTPETYLNDTTVGLLVPGEILVRYS